MTHLKKSQKTFNILWTKRSSLPIVAILFFLGIPFWSISAGDKADVAVENITLKAQLAEKEKALEQANAEYAELLINYKDLQTHYHSLRLKAASVLVKVDELSETGQLRLLLRDMKQVNELQTAAYSEILRFAKYLSTLFRIVDKSGSEMLRKQLESRLFLILQQVQEVEKLSALHTAKKAVVPGTCTVIAVNEDLKVVVIDLGRNDGIKQGMLWKDAGPTGEFEAVIVDVRPMVAAARLVKGRLKKIKTGMKLASKPVLPKKKR